MAQQILPDYFGSMMQAYGQGQQKKLGAIAADAYGSTGPARDKFVAEAVSVDPRTGMALGDGLQDRDDAKAKRLSGTAQYLVNAFKTGDKAAIQGAYRTMMPVFQEIAPPGTVLPQEADESMLPMLHQLIAAGAGGAGVQGNVQSTYIDAQGQRVAIMRDGSTQVLGANAPNNQIIDTGQGFYGVNKGNLSAAPVMIGGAPQQGAPAPQQAPQPPPMQQVQYATDDGSSVPPEDYAAVQAVMRAQSQGQDLTVPAGSAPAPMQQQGGALPPPLDPVNGGQLMRAPDPMRAAADRRAEEANARAAAAAERAAQAAQLRERGNAPAGFRFKQDGSLEPIPGGPKPAGAVASEDERKAAAWLAQATNAYGNMVSAIKEDPSADEPGLIETYSPFDEIANRSRSSDRQKYVQASESLSEALLRAATGAGVNRDEAVQKVRELTPRRGDTPAVKQQKMAAIPVYLAALKARSGRAAPGAQQNQQAATSAPQRARNPQTGEVLELRNGQWVPAQ